MTVSPPWPQDGNRNPSDAADGVPFGNPVPSPALPPTLFKLRDLRPDEPSTSGQAPSSDTAAVSSSLATAPPPAGPASPAEQAFTAPSQRESPSQPEPAANPVHKQTSVDAGQDTPCATPSPPQPRTTESVADAARPMTSPVPQPPADRAAAPVRPAGRSWMESIGSHSVVVVLLLIVVAAALVTGRGSDSQQENANLSEHGQLLDFADGASVDLPLPEEHGSQTDIASSGEAQGSLAQPDLPYSELEDSPAGINDPATASDMAALNALGLTAPQPDSSQPPATVDFDSYLDQVDASPAQSLATLDVPHAPAMQADALAGDPEQDLFQANRVKVNDFVGDGGNAERVAAAAADNGQFELPSLEDLAAGAESAIAAQTGSASPTHRLSKTPMGIEDLLRANVHQYVPAASTDTANSATSNELLSP